MRSARTEFYTAEEYAAAKEVNIAAFLMSIGYELSRDSRCYKGKLHDSLIIRDDGRWYWNSRDLHGYSPIELYKQILINDYGYSNDITAAITAVKELAGGRGTDAAGLQAQRAPEPPTRAEDEPLPMPAPHTNNNRVMAYLCKSRGLDPEIVRGLIKYGKIYETVQRWDKDKQRFVDTPYHNAVFVAYDKLGRPQNAFLRGTISMAEKPFKRDLDLSNKSFPFTLLGRKSSDRVSCFESAIDAISHAGIYKMFGVDWRAEHRISLGGTSFLGLERFLSENPQVTKITVALDNDATGNKRSDKLIDEFRQKGYEVTHKSPIEKDWNEDLLSYLQEEQEDEHEL